MRHCLVTDLREALGSGRTVNRDDCITLFPLLSIEGNQAVDKESPIPPPRVLNKTGPDETESIMSEEMKGAIVKERERG